MTFTVWTLTLWWAKRVSKEEDGPWVTGHGLHSRRCLEFVHTNIWGPITSKSFSEKKYFTTFIHNYARKT